MDQLNFCKHFDLKTGKIIIALLGVTGCGKSSLALQLKNQIIDSTILSLDECRLELNNGVYPSKQLHKTLHSKTIALYNEKFNKCCSRVIILDNTHLKFSPDYSQLLCKAIEDVYDVLVLSAPTSVFSLYKNRSIHCDDQTHQKMLFLWPCSNFRNFINQRIKHDQLCRKFSPVKFEVPIVNFPIFKWGSSSKIYIYNGYLGLMSENISISALLTVKFVEEKYKCQIPFMQFDGVLHMTLLPPRQCDFKTMKDIAQNLIKMEEFHFDFNGVSFIENELTKTYFMTPSKNSQSNFRSQIWNNVTDQPVNPTGLHITLGYTNCDIHNISKDTIPIWPCESFDLLNCSEDSAKTQITYWNSNLFKTTESSPFEDLIRSQFGLTLDDTFTQSLIMNLNYFTINSNVKFKFIQHNGDKIQNWQFGHMIVLGVQVFSKYKSDDDIYQNDAILLNTLPRGLHFVFQIKTSKLSLVDTVFPTPKFFGDQDNLDNVEIVSKKQLVEMTTQSDFFYITEKANGEMATINVLRKINEFWLLIIGSKNHKVLIQLDIENFTQDHVMHQIQMHTQKSNFATNLFDNLWAEIIICFFKKLENMINRQKFLEFCKNGHLTLNGEFESFRHPHLLSFAEGHEKIKLFCITTYNSKFQNIQFDVNEQIGCLDKLTTLYKLDCVRIHRNTDKHKSITQIKDEEIQKTECEGVVLWSVTGGKVCKFIKIKTIWYTIWRGIRETIKRTCLNRKTNFDYSNEVDWKKLSEEIGKTIAQKFGYFKIDNASQLKSEYNSRIPNIVLFLKNINSRENLKTFIESRYPALTTFHIQND